MRWCSGLSVRFAAGRPGVHSPSRVIPKDFKNDIQSFAAWRSAHKDTVEYKPTRLLVVSLGKALDRMPPFSCGRQMGGPSSLPIVVAQSDKIHVTEHELRHINK